MESKPGDLGGLAKTTAGNNTEEEPKPTMPSGAAASKAEVPKPKANDPTPAEDVPDPDEDDLDDLDGDFLSTIQETTTNGASRYAR